MNGKGYDDETKVDSGLLVRKENSAVYPPGKFGDAPRYSDRNPAPEFVCKEMGVGCYVFCVHAVNKRNGVESQCPVARGAKGAK